MSSAIESNPKGQSRACRVEITGRTADILAAARRAAASSGPVAVDWRGGKPGLPEIQIVAALEQALRGQDRELTHAGAGPETAARLALCGVAGIARPGSGGTDE